MLLELRSGRSFGYIFAACSRLKAALDEANEQLDIVCLENKNLVNDLKKAENCQEGGEIQQYAVSS